MTSDPNADSPKQDPVDLRHRAYATFLSERNALLETAKEATTQYTKAVMTLSAGALALSITFIKDLAPNPDPNTYYLIKLSWCSFALSLTAIVTSFFLAQFAFLRQVQIAEESLLKESNATPPVPPRNEFTPWIVGLSLTALLLFVGGLLCAVLFAWTNLGGPSHETIEHSVHAAGQT